MKEEFKGCGKIVNNIFGEQKCGTTKIGVSVFLCQDCSEKLSGVIL